MNFDDAGRWRHFHTQVPLFDGDFKLIYESSFEDRDVRVVDVDDVKTYHSGADFFALGKGY